MLSDQQVFHCRHILEQAHVLEGTHHAFASDLVARQAFDRFAVELDAARRGLVETGQAVEHGSFTRPVGADH
ncbi:hypothetical protein D3C85_1514780 [compost metagenome]